MKERLSYVTYANLDKFSIEAHLCSLPGRRNAHRLTRLVFRPPINLPLFATLPCFLCTAVGCVVQWMLIQKLCVYSQQLGIEIDH